MRVDRAAMRLYAVTDRTWVGDGDFYAQIDDALRGGATFLQIREKDMEHGEFVAQALKIKEIAKKHGVPFVVNDNVAAAMEVDADGVHVGQRDMAYTQARSILGEGKIVGVSVKSVAEARRAAEEGADYLGVGAIFSTSTKADADDVSFETLREICDAVNIPVVAIGGINEYNIGRLRGSGADGAAVVSAIFAADDVYGAACRLDKLSCEVFG